VRYYTAFINNSPLYTMAGIYADEGISATNTKKRDNFNRMIEDCRKGNIDMIITKSISQICKEHTGLLKLCKRAERARRGGHI